MRRGAEFLFFQGHETGIMTGSTYYLDNNWDRVKQHCVAYLNDDTPCMIGTTVYTVDSDPVCHDFMDQTIKDLAEYEGAEYRRIVGYTPWKAGDQSYLGVGVPSTRVLTVTPNGEEEKPGGWWYHSEYDTIEKCDPETLYMANKAHLLVILRLCTLPLLPYRFTPVADWTLTALDELKKISGDALDLSGLSEKAKGFKEAAVTFDLNTEELNKAFENSHEDDETKAKSRNATILKICRVINPINYTLSGTYGQDHYGAEYIKSIPVLHPLSELVKLNPDTSSFKALKTKLVREANRVSDALGEATWLAQLKTN